MKNAKVLGLFLLMKVCLYGQKNKSDLLCQKWIQFGYKMHNDSTVKFVNEDCAKKKCEFLKDNKYVEDMYCLKGYGIWGFNRDSTKFGFQYTEYMGHKSENKSPISYYTDLIVKLTADTLIIGSEGYYGNSRTYGHDDLYFVRKK